MCAVLSIAVTDICGCRRSFQAHRATFDCGAGALELQAGSPAYCRQFDDAVIRIFDASGETVLHIQNGTASFTATSLDLLCEAVRCQSHP